MTFDFLDDRRNANAVMPFFCLGILPSGPMVAAASTLMLFSG
jgi:hypothetical protein